jgi:hypothetical protein
MGSLSEESLYLSSKTVSPDNDGFEDVLALLYRFDRPGTLISANIFNLNGIHICSLADAYLAGREGKLLWNAVDNTGQIVPTGLYILLVEITTPNGTSRREKYAFNVTQRF